jgi:hypothetical protein
VLLVGGGAIGVVDDDDIDSDEIDEDNAEADAGGGGVVSEGRNGISDSGTMTDRTSSRGCCFFQSAAPIAPPGWLRAKTDGTQGWSSREATMARASPTVRATVVDVVGAATPKEAVSVS